MTTTSFDMTEIKTPNWRISSVARASTGHSYQITDRRTGSVTYFDNVTVYENIGEIKLYREDEDMGTNGARAGIIRDLDNVPTVILDALKQLEEGGTLTDLGTRLRER